MEVIDPENSSPDKSGDEEVTGGASAVSTGYTGAMVVRVKEVSEVELVEDGKKRGKGGQTRGVAVGEGIGGRDSKRRQQICAWMDPLDVPEPTKSSLTDLLEEYHGAFSLQEGELGETGLVSMQIDTGDSRPQIQQARRMPFAAAKRWPNS